MEDKLIQEGFAVISCNDFAQKLGLEIMLEGKGDLTVTTDNVCRPGLQFAGYFDHFVPERVQVMGNAETKFLERLPEQIKENVLEQFFSRGIPCLIVCRNLEVDDLVIEAAKKYDVPLFRTAEKTTNLISRLNTYLCELIAPSIILHGVMLDIMGIGVLITGTAGIGKSETALELISRGHRLVADDSVIVKCEGVNCVKASCPPKIKHYMEVRGIGIVNVKNMFGPGSVLLEKNIDLMVKLVPWEDMPEYDRLGDEKQVINVLGVDVPSVTSPVSPGRNIPIIIETAVRKVRLEQFGYNAVDELITSTFKK